MNKYPAFYTALAYVVLGSLWIVVSDWLGLSLFGPERMAAFQSIKGVFFVLVTGGLLYAALHALFKRLRVANAALRRRTQELQAILDSQIDLICRYQQDTTLVFVNDAYCRFLGRSRDDILGERFITWTTPDQQEIINQRLAEVTQTRTPDVRIIETVRPDGTRIAIEWVDQIVSPPGEPIIIQAVGRDVTERIRQRQQIIDLNHQLEERILARTQQLEEANEQLKRLNTAKEHFVSDVSHELRGPLTSLKLHVRMLEQGQGEVDKHVSVLEREVERMNHTIRDLRDLSRLDVTTKDMKAVSTDLYTLVNQYVSDRVPITETHNIELVIAPPEPPLKPVMLAPTLIEQVVGILLNNAVNYTPSGGRITFGFVQKEGYAGFAIRDTGLGITADEKKKIFSRFYRGTAARTSRAMGTGLGLPIAKGIISRHEGTLELDSTPNRGSTFTVWLPHA